MTQPRPWVTRLWTTGLRNPLSMPGIQRTYSIPGPLSPHRTCLGYRGPVLSLGPCRLTGHADLGFREPILTPRPTRTGVTLTELEVVFKVCRNRGRSCCCLDSNGSSVILTFYERGSEILRSRWNSYTTLNRSEFQISTSKKSNHVYLSW